MFLTMGASVRGGGFWLWAASWAGGGVVSCVVFVVDRWCSGGGVVVKCVVVGGVVVRGVMVEGCSDGKSSGGRV